MGSLIRERVTRLTVNPVTGKIAYRGLEMDLMPVHMALYAFFARQKQGCTLGIDSCGNCTDCFLDVQSIFAKQDQGAGIAVLQ